MTHVAVRADQSRPEGIMRVPDLHVGCIGGVAYIERVCKQQPAVFARDDVLGKPIQPVSTHRGQIGKLQPGFVPFPECKKSRSDFQPVVVVRGFRRRAGRRGSDQFCVVGFGKGSLLVSRRISPNRNSSARNKMNFAVQEKRIAFIFRRLARARSSENKGGRHFGPPGTKLLRSRARVPGLLAWNSIAPLDARRADSRSMLRRRRKKWLPEGSHLLSSRNWLQEE